MTQKQGFLKRNVIVVCVLYTLGFEKIMSANIKVVSSVFSAVEGVDSSAKCAIPGIGSTSCSVATVMSMFARTAAGTASEMIDPSSLLVTQNRIGKYLLARFLAHAFKLYRLTAASLSDSQSTWCLRFIPSSNASNF